MGVSKLAVAVVVMLMVVVIDRSAVVEGAITRGQVSTILRSCVPYLKNGEPAPSAACCNGVRGLNGLAKTTPDRKQACIYLKSLAATIRGINYGNAAALPGKCGVRIPFPISPSTDCSRVT